MGEFADVEGPENSPYRKGLDDKARNAGLDTDRTACCCGH
jgi:hypothetical protein